MTVMAESSPFFGRTAEVDAAMEAFSRAGRGQSQTLLITGEAGIGKTRFLEELTTRISTGTCARLRTGAAIPLIGPTFPYGPFTAALHDLADWLPPDGQPTHRTNRDCLTARWHLFERVLALLADLAAHTPFVLILEDLQWADRSSRDLLTFLAVRLRAEQVLLAATIREEDLTHDALRWLAELAAAPASPGCASAGCPTATSANSSPACCPNAATGTKPKPSCAPPTETPSTPANSPAPKRPGHPPCSRKPSSPASADSTPPYRPSSTSSPSPTKA